LNRRNRNKNRQVPIVVAILVYKKLARHGKGGVATIRFGWITGLEVVVDILNLLAIMNFELLTKKTIL